MGRLLSYVFSPRGLVLTAIVVAACWLSSRYSQHHEGKNVFTTLYMHVVPAVLVEPGAHEAASAGEGAHAAEHTQKALLEVKLPDGTLDLGLFKLPIGAWMRAMDYRGKGEHTDGPKTALYNLQIFQ